MCGIIGLVAKSAVNRDLYDGLTMLQHRGQDAAGIMTCEGERLYLRKGTGLVRDVFNSEAHMINLRGNMGIGHVRYPTAGNTSVAETQPLYTNTPYGISLAHNGNLTNTDELRHTLFEEDKRHVNTDSDTDVLLNVLAHEMMATRSSHLTPDDVFDAVSRMHKRVRGAYACVAMIANYGILGFRDPHGIRPVVYGHRMSQKGIEYMIASESVALDALGFETIADIAPGEAVLITQDGRIFTRQCAIRPTYSPCIFEYVYLARPDSVMDGIYVYKARLRMGEALAEKIKREWPDNDIDVVIPIPDTSRVAGSELANQLGVKYREGFIKNRYIGRTFIMPGQAQRQRSVRQKLNPIDVEFNRKNVLLVDDSIVRGTTSREIIQMARDAGARKVYFASAAPPVRYPNVYGIDMPIASELIAHGRTVKELETLLGADRLIYQDLDDLIEAVRHKHSDIQQFDTSVFTGEYITHDVDSAYLSQLELFRSDAAKAARRARYGDNVIELSNAG
ncbi:MAG: amidophosphoribosyltransferase [Nevskiaceae bacterium]|nr:MAG: amidophosphoribosyltransferase [Nevskiaceae bacterium]TBR74685.1 MAG: amidophosphoribosyltransferase [Nevskiaceae bacterium]